MKKYTNKLIDENSPYLLQHAHNPVNWYPWGEEALEKARLENKAIIISVGYAACHWCHVMEHESFEDKAVAQIMNDHFVSIKVDREERPDIDQIYMNAVQLLSGRGGWPLNAIALPDGRPFYGGTYFPKENWMSLLTQINTLFNQDKEKLIKQAEALTQGISESELIQLNQSELKFTKEDHENSVQHYLQSLDTKFGGMGNAPKFPMPVDYQFLLSSLYYLKDDKIAYALGLTLDKMALGGIFDQAGGGFARYSVDSFWKVPHFEKMLYDNGQLISLYANAYKYTKKDLYKETVEKTIDFIQRELMSDENAFYSALDADSEGVEGLFYIWKKEELYRILAEDFPIIESIYEITEEGNWENGYNILHQWEDDETVAKKLSIPIQILKETKERAFIELMKIRKERIRPALDDKVILSWNALMLKGLIDAYRSFSKPEFLELAIKNADFLLDNMINKDQSAFRSYKNSKGKITAFLDDHAFLIDALIELYQASFDIKWLHSAKEQMDYVIENFSDEKSGMFFYTSLKSERLIARKMEISDNVIPASNSQMAINLKRLAYFYDDSDYHKRSNQMLNNMIDSVKNQGRFFSNWGNLLLWNLYEPVEIAIVGENAKALRQEFDEYYIGNALFLSGNETDLDLLKNKAVDGKTLIYVCHNKNCQRPVETVKEALELL